MTASINDSRSHLELAIYPPPLMKAPLHFLLCRVKLTGWSKLNNDFLKFAICSHDFSGRGWEYPERREMLVS
jgi:hypothetical protein